MKHRVKLAAGLGIAFTVGAVLAPISTATAGHENAVLETKLKGRAEVPTEGKSKRNVGDPNGRGEAYVFGVDGDTKTLCYVLTVKKIKPATSAHIHKGPRGENGPIVANLGAPTDGNAGDCLTEGEEGPPGTEKFPTGELVADILANPGDYYVNVHNEQFPDGAVRGQLKAQR